MPWRRPYRLWRHIITDRADARRAFPAAALDRIEHAIAEGEQRHSGQVVFAIEPALPLTRVLARVPPSERALEVFGLLRAWDTEHNNGVLIYLLLADHDVEIVADRGIHHKVGDGAWQKICSTMEAAFRDGRFEDGMLAGVGEINALLAAHFPRHGGSAANELSDRPLVL